SSRRRHTRFSRDWSSDVCSSDLPSLKGFLGVLVGFSGVAFIFREGFEDLIEPSYIKGILFLACAMLGWAVGTIYAKKNSYKSDRSEERRVGKECRCR